MEIVHNESTLKTEMRALIATAVDENIDFLEETLIQKAKPRDYQTIYDHIDEYAKYISTILDKTTTDLMNRHIAEADTSEIIDNIDIDPIISQLDTVMNYSKQQKKQHQPQKQNVSLTKKINDLLLHDLTETKSVFDQLISHLKLMSGY